jgi:putative ABC transport system permease protein
LTALGVVAGVALSFALARTLSSMLFEIQIHDAVTFVLAPVVLAAVAFLACYFPARRATRVNPMIALRVD